jgi:hypothetical protein
VKYQLLTAWPIGQFCIEAGTELNLSKPASEMSNWEKLADGRVPPAGAIALDEEARGLMKWAHPSRGHPSRDAVPSALSGLEFKLDGERIIGFRRKGKGK